MAAPIKPHELLHWNMVHAHATFKVGFTNILSLLDSPPTDDLYNFLGLCEAWAEAIHCHHDSEEAVVFPFLREKLDFSDEIEQHKVIHTALDAALAHIRAAKAAPSTFSAQKLKDMMGQLRQPLFEHLDAEVLHVAPENLRIFSEADLLGLDDRLTRYAQTHGDPFLLLPFMRSHTSPQHKDVWPPLPWVLRKVLIPYVFALRHSGYWKYSPYAMS